MKVFSSDKVFFILLLGCFSFGFNLTIKAQCPILDPSFGTAVIDGGYGDGIDVCTNGDGTADITLTFLTGVYDFDNWFLYSNGHGSFLFDGDFGIIYNHTGGSNVYVFQNVPDVILGVEGLYVFRKLGCLALGGTGIDIDPNDELRIEAVNLSITDNTRCVAPFNGAINIVVSGGHGTFTYSWTSPNSFTSSAQNISALEPGTYTILITDEHNCTYTQDIEVVDDSVNPVVSISGLNLAAEYCEDNGIVALTGSEAPNGIFSGTSLINIINGTADFDPSIAAIGSNVITYTYTDGLGCTGISAKDVMVFSLPADPTNPVGNSFCTGEVIPPISVDDPGAGLTIDWYDAPAGGNLVGTGISFTPAVAQTYWAEVVNTSCNSANRVSATLTENPLPADAANPVDNSYCTGSLLTSLSVDDPGAGFRIDWYNASTGGSLAGTGFSFIPALPGTYWAEVVNETTLCTSSTRISATLTENLLPSDAANPVDNSYCIGDAIPAISVNDPGVGFRVDWYNASTGGALSGTGVSFIPAIPGTYWAEIVDEATFCTSANRISATLTEIPLPLDATNPVDNSFCTGGAINPISVDDPGAGFRVDWYDASTAGTLVGTGVSFTPASVGTYWAEVVSTAGGCISANRVSADLIANPLPSDATNPVDNVYCAGDALTAISVDDPGVGFRIDWYDANTVGSLAGTGASFIPAVAGAYWAEIVNETTACISANRVSATLTENPIPSDATNPVDNLYCAGDALTPISIDDPGIGYRVDWYDATTGGNLVGTGVSFTPISAGVYWAEIVNETTGCLSANRLSASLIAVPLPADATNPVDNVYCEGDALTAISVDDPGAGFRIDWYDAITAGALVGTGVSFIPASVGTYWAEVVSTVGGCISTNRVSATLTENPIPSDATNPVGNSYCTGDAFPAISVDDPGAGFRIDWYDASTGGSLTGTGASFTPSTAGVFWAEIVNTSTGCSSANRISATLLENLVPLALTITGNSNPACQASEIYTVALTAGSNYAWTTPLNATITAPVDLNSVEINFAFADGDITVIETDVNGCSGPQATFSVALQSCPLQADFASDVSVVCVNSPVTFTDASAASPGVSYSWDFGVDANPGTDNTTGPISVSYSSPGLKTVTLSLDDGSQVSTQTKVDYIDVRPLPTAILSGDAGICIGSSPVLTFDLTGTGPWDIVYTDGTSTFSETANSTPHLVGVSPVVATTYTMVSVNDALCTGTVSGSADITIAPTKEVSIRLDSISGLPGNQVAVPLRVIDFEDMMTMQFTVAWDPNLLTYSSVTGISIGNASASSFGTTDVNNGFLTFSWNTASWSDTTIVDSTAIFTINFDVANTVCSDASVTIDESPTAITVIELADELACIANTTIKGGNVEINATALITSDDADNLICFGDQVLFVSTPGGMTNYEFYLNGVQVQTGGNSVYVNSALVDQDSVNVIVRDAQGCTLAAQGIITTVNQITVTPTTTDISGCGLSDGAIALTVAGGSGTYSYTWTGPSIVDPALQDQSSLGRGFYNVIVTDDVSACTESVDVELKEPVTFTLSTTKIDVTTTGGSDGSINLTITGGTGPFTVNWTGPNGFTSTNEDISGLFAGTYTGTVNDTGEGCTDAITVEILQPINVLVLNSTKTDVSTCGANDGTINLLISGGSGNYSILWIGPNSFNSTSQNISALEGGLYIATVLDLVTSLTAQWTVQIDEPEGFTLNTTVSEISYCAGADGTIVLDVAAGSGDFNYAWRDLDGLGFTSTNKDVTNLALADYRVVVTDNVYGCIDSVDATVARPAICDLPCSLNASISTNATTCPDSLSGSATAFIISGGSGFGNYYISLDTGQTYLPFDGDFATAVSNLGKGSHLYQVKDTVTSCTQDLIANVSVSSILAAQISIEDASCAGGDGRIFFNVSGVSPIEVSLIYRDGTVFTQSGAGLFTFADLDSGSYFYEIKENSTTNDGCSILASDSIQLINDCQTTACTTLTATAGNFEDATCGSDSNGKAIVDVTGGSSPYEYSTDGASWIPFISGNVIDSLPPNGIYNIVIRQDTLNVNCRAEVSVEIYGPAPLTLEIPIFSTQAASCNQNDGAVKIGRVAGGIVPYTYQIDGTFVTLASDSIITDLGAGIHTFGVIDNVGCTENFQFEVQSPGVIVAHITEVPVSCSSIFLKAGIRVEVDLDSTTLPGPYEAYVARTSDPENGTIHQIPEHNGVRTILNLDKDFYSVVITSGSDEGCSYSESIAVFSGAYPLDFDIIDSDSIVNCIGEFGSITIGNVLGDPDTTYIVQLISESDVLLETYQLNSFELEGGFTIDESNTDKLVAGKYYIKMIQYQTECAHVEAISDLINIYEPLGNLGLEVLVDSVSLADRPTGFIIGEIIQSGGDPYEGIIQLIEPVFQMNITDIIHFNEQRTWEEFPSTGDNLNRYPVRFDSLWAGLYEMRVRDEYGCEFTMEYDIGYDEKIFIPNVFTPNQDGFNDAFNIRNLPESGTKVIISNRNGFVIFESDDYNENSLWDGGTVADGIYYYHIEITGIDEPFRGWVEKWSGTRP